MDVDLKEYVYYNITDLKKCECCCFNDDLSKGMVNNRAGNARLESMLSLCYMASCVFTFLTSRKRKRERKTETGGWTNVYSMSTGKICFADVPQE